MCLLREFIVLGITSVNEPHEIDVFTVALTKENVTEVKTIFNS